MFNFSHTCSLVACNRTIFIIVALLKQLINPANYNLECAICKLWDKCITCQSLYTVYNKNMDLIEAVNLTLWWTEGTKLRRNKRWGSYIYSIELTNTDPVIISMFLGYLRNRLGVQNSRIKVQLQIHEGDIQEELESFWINVTKVPKEQFNKTIIRPVGNKIGKSRGTCKIRIHDKALFMKLDESLNKLRGLVHR